MRVGTHIARQLLATLLAIVCGFMAAQEALPPMSKSDVLTALQAGVTPERLIETMRQRRVGFAMTIEGDREFRLAGAPPLIIDALWRYDLFQPPGGAPLSENEVVVLLESGVPAARVLRFVEGRKVRFRADEAIARRLRAAGGDDPLILAIGLNYRDLQAEANARREAETLLWESIKKVEQPEPFELYLQRFPEGEHSAEARSRLTAIQAARRLQAMGRLHIYNIDGGQPSIFLDRSELAVLPSGQHFIYYCQPGERVLQAGSLTAPGLHLKVVGGKAYYLKVDSGFSKTILREVSPIIGREEFARAKTIETENLRKATRIK